MNHGGNQVSADPSTMEFVAEHYVFLEGRGMGWAGVSGVRVTRGVKRRGKIIDMHIVGAKSNPKG